MRAKSMIMAMLFAAAVLMFGCGADNIADRPVGSTTRTAPIIDLDKVLKIMASTLKEMEPKKPLESEKPKTDSDQSDKPKTDSAESDKPKTDLAKSEKPKTPPPMDKAKEKEFLDKLAMNLNDADIYAKPVGVTMLTNGTIVGFEDPNKNNIKEGGEKELFKVQVDGSKQRLVASDPQNTYHRDHGFGGMGMGSGLIMGYLLGNILNRHSAAGLSPNRFDNVKMSPPAQPRASTSPARTRTGDSGTTRPRGGSKGFSRKGRR
jgi:hypothetical protein